MDNLEIDFNQLINTALLAGISKDNPTMGKVIAIFVKRGLSVQEALAILLELGESIK